jgi:hypothetical protein
MPICMVWCKARVMEPGRGVRALSHGRNWVYKLQISYIDPVSILCKLLIIWGGRRDSNPRPPEPQSGALPS